MYEIVKHTSFSWQPKKAYKIDDGWHLSFSILSVNPIPNFFIQKNQFKMKKKNSLKWWPHFEQLKSDQRFF